jgi:hypothetical protein
MAVWAGAVNRIWCTAKPAPRLLSDDGFRDDSLSRRATRPRSANKLVHTGARRSALIARVKKELVTTKRDICRLHSRKIALEMTLEDILVSAAETNACLAGGRNDDRNDDDGIDGIDGNDWAIDAW